jgi:IclR family pca regulon transcriptional regulator
MAAQKNPRDDGEYINSLARGLSVLRAFSKERPEMTLSEVAAEAELSPAVARRCLHTLMHLGHVSTNRMIRLAAGVGTRFPAYATSLGRVLLAWQDPSFLEKYLSQVDFRAFTHKTTTSVTKLRKILKHVHREGFASVQDELDYGIVSVSVPILDDNEHILAAINCSTATTRITHDEMVETRLPVLKEAAKRIELELRRYPVLAHSVRR